jgi:hypothetical protein
VSALREPRVREPSLLALACGLRAAIDRFDRLLARHAAPPSGPALERTADEVSGGAPDEATEMVLGLLALRDRIARELARAHAAGGGERPAPPRMPLRMLGGLLR